MDLTESVKLDQPVAIQTQPFLDGHWHGTGKCQQNQQCMDMILREAEASDSSSDLVVFQDAN